MQHCCKKGEINAAESRFRAQSGKKKTTFFFELFILLLNAAVYF